MKRILACLQLVVGLAAGAALPGEVPAADDIPLPPPLPVVLKHEPPTQPSASIPATAPATPPASASQRVDFGDLPLPPPLPTLGSLTRPATGQSVPAPSAEPATQPSTLPDQSDATGDNSQLRDVIVTGDRPGDAILSDTGSRAYTIGPAQLQSIPGGDNATFQQVLVRAPGVVADSFGQEHVRGEHGNLEYRVNGVFLPDGLNGFGQNLDTRIAGSVTLLDGALPAEFGFRTAGVVDVATKSGTSLNANELSLYGGSYNTLQPSLQLGGSYGKLDYFLTASYKQNGIGIENPTPSTDPQHDWLSQKNAFLYLSYHVDDTSRLSLLLNGSYSDYQIPTIAGKPPIFALDGVNSANSADVNESQNEQDYYSVISYQTSGDKLSFVAAAFSRYGAIQFTPDSTNDLIFSGISSRILNTFLASGVQFDATYILDEKNTVRAGLLGDYTSEILDTSSSVFPTDSSGDQAAATPFTIADNGSNWGAKSGIYLQDEWKVADRVTVNFGARYDRFDASFDRESQLSPRINLVWKVDDATTAHAGYSRYFTPPPVQYVLPATVQRFGGSSNAAGNLGDGPPKVERSNYYDVGISRQINSAFEVTLDAFYKGARNLIDLGQFGNAIILSPYNFRSGVDYGGEISGNYKMGGLSLFGNFAYVNATGRNIDSSQYEFAGDEIAYIASHSVPLDHESLYTASAGATYTWKDNRISLDMLYGSGLRAGFANSQKEPHNIPVSLGYEHIFHPSWRGVRDVRLRFDIINLFDEVYQIRNGTGIGVGASQYGQRRSFFAGLSYDF